MIEVETTKLEGVVLIKPRVFGDDRGFFVETFNQRDALTAGLPAHFVQDNHSYSRRGVLRGLHFQYPTWQGKLVRAITGEIFDVAVDIRVDSKTYGQWVGAILSRDNQHQLYVPEGFAHGFCVLSEGADVAYKCTTLYEPSQDRAVRWDDPAIGIEWPIADPLVSDKDATAPFLQEIKNDIAV